MGAAKWGGNLGQGTGERRSGGRELRQGKGHALPHHSGEHLFQASALPRNRMRPAIFHAFGKAKVEAQVALRDLERQGWKTLPIAMLGMPNLPPAWAVDTWKPIGGGKFAGFSSVRRTVGNSALRFCLLLKWRAILPGNSDLFPGQVQGDSLSCCPGGMMTSSQLPHRSSNTSSRRVSQLAQAVARESTNSAGSHTGAVIALALLCLWPTSQITARLGL